MPAGTGGTGRPWQAGQPWQRRKDEPPQASSEVAFAGGCPGGCSGDLVKSRQERSSEVSWRDAGCRQASGEPQVLSDQRVTLCSSFRLPGYGPQMGLSEGPTLLREWGWSPVLEALSWEQLPQSQNVPPPARVGPGSTSAPAPGALAEGPAQRLRGSGGQRSHRREGGTCVTIPLPMC